MSGQPVKVLEVARRVVMDPLAATMVSTRELRALCDALLEMDRRLVAGTVAVTAIDKLADGKTAGRLAKAQHDLDAFADGLRSFGYMEDHHAKG